MQDVLTGMRVVEGSAFVAAPSGGMSLAQLGADVIRFDPIGGGLDYRRWPVTCDGHSLYWRSLNKGKRSVAVDLRQPAGRELLAELVCAPGDDAGLFLTNFPARGWLDYESLRRRREDLIYVNLTGDRHGGSALDYTVNCRVGFPHLNRPDGGPPLNNPLPAWDLLAGQHIALGLLAAERHRSRSGRGQLVKLALADVALAAVGNLGYLAELDLASEQRPVVGNGIFGTFGRDFLTGDGVRLMIVGVSPTQWRAIVKVTNTTEALDTLAAQLGLDFAEEGDRYAAQDAICALIEPWFAGRDFDSAASQLEAAGVCWGRYQSMSELLRSDPECSTANPLFGWVDDPGVGRHLAPGSPLVFGEAERGAIQRAPLLGEHTDEVLADIVGLGSGAIGRLHDAGVIAGAEPQALP